ncbi:Low-affinity potassium transport protein [Hypsizygus marmoreus]|uniref:Low-affinity potassium transport protein n=1 Tax=Hypsizygus marmoreus TaxID=39966 RepID=A0A369J874_HYPMA|nr:Low-affinity potassium transport protein [Hypsizygus marmoreus]
MSTTANNSEYQSEPPVQSPRSLGAKLINYIQAEATFFRIHLGAFVLIPLISSGIFYASNGRFHVKFVDALFLCYSAMTATGLTTVNLSTLTVWQQVILFLLMGLGNITTVSWIMVLVRKHYFKSRCEYVASIRMSQPKASPSFLIGTKDISGPHNARKMNDAAPLRNGTPPPGNLNIQLIRPTPGATLVDDDAIHNQHYTSSPKSVSAENIYADGDNMTYSPQALSIELPATVSILHHEEMPISPTSLRQRRVMFEDVSNIPYPKRGMTMLNPRTTGVSGAPTTHKHDGLGGFPGPLELSRRFIRRAAPGAYRKVQRSMTLPYTSTLDKASLSNVVVGRNSDFHTESLTDEQIEEIGGTEYRALRLLSYLIPAYFVTTQLMTFLLFAPWLSATKQYDHVFASQPRLVQKPWFSLFLTLSAYSGAGFDLVDLSMVPFQEAYLMIFGLIFVLLAGNHALVTFFPSPVFLRFIIWITSRFTTEGSEAWETFQFLLQHPRRCFLYLFPSHQTWFLTIVLTLLSALEWASFGILNIGLPTFESLPIGPKVVIGLFQGMTVRASGLTIIPLGNLAPAMHFLYIVLMYIAVYPIGMCIRATNVYEERSLGIFEAPEGDLADNLETLEPRERVGKYLGWHLRQQLSNDIWWLIWGIFLITVLERGNIVDDANKPWFNVFSIIFELVSAFSGIGLSLGFANDNFSLVGAFRPLSKLVVIVIMIRGRHRGLPVAVDRAVLLPNELVPGKQGQTPHALPDNEKYTPDDVLSNGARV